MKPIFVVLGFIFLAVGAVGVYLPILPTTPFLLLSAACFARGSEKFHTWLIGTKLYQHNIEPILSNEGLTKQRKFKILVAVTLLFVVSFFLIHQIHARIALFVVLFGHYYYFIFKVKTRKVKL